MHLSGPADKQTARGVVFEEAGPRWCRARFVSASPAEQTCLKGHGAAEFHLSRQAEKETLRAERDCLRVRADSCSENSGINPLKHTAGCNEAPHADGN